MSITVMLLCTIPGEEKWVHLKDSREKRVKDQDCTRGENPSIFKMFLMLPKEYFVGPPEIN